MYTNMYKVSANTDNGLQLWNNRTTSSISHPNANIGPLPHISGSTWNALYTIFTVTGIEQGRQINSAKLRIRSGTSWLNTTRTYIAVENHLDPTSSGSATPFQRLTRYSTATTAYGNRAGPTHNKAGETLSSYGATPRDPSALIYPAFADGRVIPATSWFDTDSFAPALQKLVDDPGWNSTSQRVMIHMFPDRTNNTDHFNIGSLAGFTWENGVIGSSDDYTNNAGNMYFWYHYVGGTTQGPYAPELIIDHESSLSYYPMTVSGVNHSSGYAETTGSNKVVQWRGLRYDRPVASSEWLLPGFNCDTDHSFSQASCGNPHVNGEFPFAPRIKRGTSNNVPSGRTIEMESFADWATYVAWDMSIGHDQSYYEIPISCYSARFYYHIDGNGLSGQFPSPIKFRVKNGSSVTDSWRIKMQTFTAENTSGTICIDTPSGQITPYTEERLYSPGSQFYRIEIQADANRDPNVRIRVYLNNSTTLYTSLEANVPNVQCNNIVIGNTNVALLYPQAWGDLEVHSNYDLSGEFEDPVLTTRGYPYVPEEWKWFEYVSPDPYQGIQELDDLGTVVSVNPDGSDVVLDSIPLTLEDDNRESFGVENNAFMDVVYASGGRRLNLYTPTGTPPSDGWPLIMWVHGGFFVVGNRNQLTDQLRDFIIHQKFAVASITYRLSTIGLIGAYPELGSEGGRYPSHIVDIKVAANWLKENAATYGLNPDHISVSGFSAGGYIAQGAFVSRGLTNDGFGRDLTLAGNQAANWGGSDVPDPVFRGCYSWCGPVSMQMCVDADLGKGFPTLSGNSVMVSGVKGFAGRNQNQSYNLDGMGIQELMVQNAANLTDSGPLFYNAGGTDFLVHSWQQLPVLEQACQETGVPYDFFVDPHVNHGNAPWEFNPDHLTKWLNQIR